MTAQSIVRFQRFIMIPEILHEVPLTSPQYQESHIRLNVYPDLYDKKEH